MKTLLETSASIISECESLLQELEGFKDNPDFHEYGFGAGGPFHAWQKKVDELRDRTPKASEIGLPAAGLPGYVRQLGMEFMKSRGKETPFTKEFYAEIFPEAKKATE